MRFKWFYSVVTFSLALLWFTLSPINAQQRSGTYQFLLDQKDKMFYILDADNKVLISGLQIVLHTSVGDIRLGSSEFSHLKPKKYNTNDSLGTARVFEYTAVNRQIGARITYRATIYHDFPGIAVEALLTNTSGKELKVYSIEPLHVTEKNRGVVRGNFKKALLNGAMYYDAGRIHELGTPYVKGTYYGEMKGGHFRSTELDDNPETAYSWWNIGLFDSYTSEGLSIGYLGNNNSLGRIKWLMESPSTHSLIVESVFYEGMSLPPGKTISSDPVLISKGADPYETLENYATAMGKANNALTGRAINGWCNWFYTHENFSEDEILKNAKFISDKLLPYGMETVQIDEGYQVAHGDWQGNSRFPNGLKSFTDSIRALGLKPGIWIAPFVISEKSWVYNHHPEWLMKKKDGNLKRIGPWPGEDTDWFKNEAPKRYGLDITHPEAEKWFISLMDSMANVYGFEMIKIDFVAWTVFSAELFYDPSASPAAVYRKALSIMHRIGGERCHILDCGPGQVSVGQIYSMRIELDANYGFFRDVWKTYFVGPSSSADALGKRFYFHNRTWTNDIDHICIDLVTYQQAQAITSLIALSGGNTMSGDRLVSMDEIRLKTLQKAFPSTGISARPVNFLEKDPQTVFAVPCSKDSIRWTVAGFFNPDTARMISYEFPLERLWLDPSKSYLGFDFWKQRFAGEITGKITMPVDAGGVSLLAIHEKTGFPQVISSTRHVFQGLIENEHVSYDYSTNTLSGRYLGPKNSINSLFIYLPELFWWDASPGKLFRDYGKYTVKYTEPNILRVDFRFEGAEAIDWKIEFRK